MTSIRALIPVFTLGLLCACSAKVGKTPTLDLGYNPSTGKLTACDATRYASMSLADVEKDFTTNVEPLFWDPVKGCASCHADNSGRPFLVLTDALITFDAANQGGFLQTIASNPAGILNRLTTPNATLAMPPGGARWAITDVGKVNRVVCELSAVDAGAPDEQFPAALLLPYAGTPIQYYDNTFVNYPQLKGKVMSVFNDNWVRDGGDNFETNIGELGGADFVNTFTEAPGATPSFLLVMDSLTKDVCSKAVANHTGPFQGLDTTSAIGTASAPSTVASQGLTTLYQRMLFRAPTAQEVTNTASLLSDVSTITSISDAWSGVCEALMRHPDFLFTLPPSRATTTDTATRAQLLLTKVAQDLVARPPTPTEVQQLTSGQATLSQMVSQYLSGAEFQSYMFYRLRVRTETNGSVDGDEPARLWTYLTTSGKPFSQLLTADYGLDPNFNPVSRDPVHGRTGLLTMKGYIDDKPGLPHYNYSARVLSDFMGYVFAVTPDIIKMRLGATAASTVDPNSICITCHQLLTPLAYQRSAWDDTGAYHTTDAQGNPIDDSDQGLVSNYPYKGKGMEAFSTKAVLKEMFIRHTLDAEYYLLLGRPMRYDQDERVIYKQLWDEAQSSNQNLQSTIQAIIASSTYQGP